VQTLLVALEEALMQLASIRTAPTGTQVLQSILTSRIQMHISDIPDGRFFWAVSILAPHEGSASRLFGGDKNKRVASQF
jgi:hypothetical protein